MRQNRKDLIHKNVFFEDFPENNRLSGLKGDCETLKQVSPAKS